MAVRRATVRGRGQVTIPSDIRRAAHLEEGDLVEVEVVADGILLRPRKHIDPTQAWFWEPEWQKGEAEAEAEGKRGKGRIFLSSDEFLASLDDS